MEREFKVGDKVKIPKQKTVHSHMAFTYAEFLQEIKLYKSPYLIIDRICKNNNSFNLKRNNGKALSACNFDIKDLEHYEENTNKMEKTAKLSLEVARQMYKSNDSAIRMFALENYSEEELKEFEVPITWEDLKKIEGNYIDKFSHIIEVSNLETISNNRNTFPTESLAKGALALSQLLQLRNAWWNGWNPWEQRKLLDTKYGIYFGHETRTIYVANIYSVNKLFVFKTIQIAEKFKETFKDLLWEAREYL